MKLSEHLSKAPRGEATRIAKAIGSHVPDVISWSKPKGDKRHRVIPQHFGGLLEAATQGRVWRKDNFENWQTYWPELIKGESCWQELLPELSDYKEAA